MIYDARLSGIGFSELYNTVNAIYNDHRKETSVIVFLHYEDITSKGVASFIFTPPTLEKCPVPEMKMCTCANSRLFLVWNFIESHRFTCSRKVNYVTTSLYLDQNINMLCITWYLNVHHVYIHVIEYINKLIYMWVYMRMCMCVSWSTHIRTHTLVWHFKVN